MPIYSVHVFTKGSFQLDSPLASSMVLEKWSRLKTDALSLSLPCLSGLIRCFALHNLCDLNPNSWVASVAQSVERLP